MGSICAKDKTNKIIIKSNAKPGNTPTPNVPPKTMNTYKYVGEEFQQEIEKNDPSYSQKQQRWNQYYQKKYDLMNDANYSAFLKRSPSIEQILSNNTTLHFQFLCTLKSDYTSCNKGVFIILK